MRFSLRFSRLLAVVLLLGFARQPAQATPPDEGMWFPLLIGKNYSAMQKLGFKLTPEAVYSINTSSLKDAVVSLGGFCTAEVISDQGLLLTNHHCAYDGIQKLSTLQDNILTNGFFAKSLKEERPIPGLTVSFLREVRDLTAEVLDSLKGATDELARNKKLESAAASIEARLSENGKYRVDLEEFYEGSEYFVFIYDVYKDVRLVGNPPESIGKFGGDTDNWEWPRHTGDFSLLRVYAGKDNQPAEYSADNQPLKPKHSLPVNIGGIKPGDFAMIMGYPGRTDRYLTSYAVEQLRTVTLPASFRVRNELLKIMKSHMDMSPATRLQYASKYSRLMNYYKLYGGRIRAFQRLGTEDDLRKEEEAFRSWVSSNTDRQAKYGNVLDQLKTVYATTNAHQKPYTYMVEGLFYTLDLTRLASRFRGLHALLKDYNEAKASEAEKAQVKAALKTIDDFKDGHFKDLDLPTDRDMLVRFLEMFHKEIDPAYHPAWLTENHKKYKGDWAACVDAIFKKSFLTSRAEVMLFLQKPKFATLDKDPGFELMNAFLTNYIMKSSAVMQSQMNEEKRLQRTYIQGMREKAGPDALFYPDANFTMRLTYGTVQPYDPADAVSYDYLTTLDGILEKYVPGDEEFDCPKRLLELAEKRDYGRYADANGQLPVCFLSTNDITGGNSGSPVMNGSGELIGLAFDGNIESASGDYIFDPDLQRTINVDIRYVLWIIEKYAGATNIISELKLVGK